MDACRKECAVERTLDLIGNRWTSLIVRELLMGTKRFNEIKKNLEHISPKTLTERLRELEEQGLITRTVYPEVPPRVEYALTEKGRALGPIFEAMREWGSRWT
ncbi:MAG: transcriptional regulator [Meiothermus sp.]